MRIAYFLFLVATAGIAIATDAPVQMKALRVSPSDLYFKVGYLAATDEVMEIRVTGVAPDSAADKSGIRPGDLLTAIRGVTVVGMKRSSLYTQDNRISVAGELTFTGHRGLFHRPWSITVEATSLREKPSFNNPLQPTPGSVTPRATESISK